MRPVGRMDDFRGQRQERTEGGRTVITEPGRVIVQDPNGQSFVRHNDVDRFRYGARDVRVTRVAGIRAPSSFVLTARRSSPSTMNVVACSGVSAATLMAAR